MINVKAVWKEESREWNPNFRRSLLSREKDLWNQISAEWKQPTSNTENDYYKWKHTVGGLFTVKSMKKNTHASTPQSSFLRCWLSLVQHLPKKCIIFMWTILNKGLDTGDKCQIRSPKTMLSPNWCILCKMNNESVEHIFIHYPFSKFL